MTEQNEGRKDQPITGSDLYNFAVQTDANFMTVRGEIRNIGTVMNSEFKLLDNEFKLVRIEMASGFAAVDAEFKAVRAEMKEGFARLRIEIQRSNWRVSASTIGALITLFGIDRFWL